MLSPALPDPHQASAGHVYQPPPPPLEAVHCITRKPGWKVLPDLSQIFPLFLVLLSGATHNEAPFSVTGLTTLEKSAARLKDLNAIQSLSLPSPYHGRLLKGDQDRAWLVQTLPSVQGLELHTVSPLGMGSQQPCLGRRAHLPNPSSSPHQNSAEGALQWSPAGPWNCSCCSWGPAISTQHPSLLPHHGGVAESCLPADFLRQKASPPPAQPIRDTPLVVAHGRTS